jgi:hypothetical protein
MVEKAIFEAYSSQCFLMPIHSPFWRTKPSPNCLWLAAAITTSVPLNRNATCLQGEYRVVYRKSRVTARGRIVEGVDPKVCYFRHRFSGRSVDWLLAIITEEFWKFSQSPRIFRDSFLKKKSVNAFTVTYKPFVASSHIVLYISLQVKKLLK